MFVSVWCHIFIISLYFSKNIKGWDLGGWGGGGGTQIFSYISRLGPFLGVQNCEFQYFGGFQKNISRV